MCNYNAAITLNQGSPAGGTYTGNGVSGGQFDPATAGNGTSTLVYSYIDGNGCMNSATSDVVVDDCASINETTTEFVSIFPNPSDGLITIDAGKTQIKSVKVYDYAGRLVKEINAVNSTVLKTDLSTFSQGAYHISVATESEVTHQVLMLNK